MIIPFFCLPEYSQKALRNRARFLASPDDTTQGRASAADSATATADKTEASFGPAEISHNPRLEKVTQMGAQPRQNPFSAAAFSAIEWAPRPAEVRQDSDESNSSKPTAITDSSKGSSGGSSLGQRSAGATTSSTSHHGQNQNTLHPRPRHYIAAAGSDSVGHDRIGVGERGGPPEPIQQASPVRGARKAPPCVADNKRSRQGHGQRPAESEGGSSGSGSRGTFGG